MELGLDEEQTRDSKINAVNEKVRFYAQTLYEEQLVPHRITDSWCVLSVEDKKIAD